MANKDISNGFRKLTGGNIDALNTVYATVALACEAIPNVLDGDGVNLRYGKVVQIGTVTDFLEHHWFGGFLDDNLVPKVDSSKFEQSLNPSNKNLFNPASIVTNKRISLDGSLVDDTLFNTSDFIAIEPLKPYTGWDGTRRMRVIVFFTSAKTVISGNDAYITTITSPANAAYARFSYQKESTTFQFEQSPTPTSYTPFSGKIEAIGGNELDAYTRKETDQLSTEIPAYIAGKNALNTNVFTSGFVLASSDGQPIINSTGKYSDYIPVTAGQVRTFSGITFGSSTHNVFSFYDIDKNFISFLAGVANRTHTIPTNAAYVRMNLQVNGVPTSIELGQYEIGSTATAFEPFSQVLQKKDGSTVLSKTKTSLVEADSDLGLNSKKITALGDAVNDTDALNLKVGKQKFPVLVNLGTPNLIDFNNLPAGTTSIVNGTSGLVASNSDGKYAKLEVLPSTQYTFGGITLGSDTHYVFSFYDATDTYITGSVIRGSANFTHTTPSDAKYVYFNLRVNGVPTDYTTAFYVKGAAYVQPSYKLEAADGNPITGIAGTNSKLPIVGAVMTTPVIKGNDARIYTSTGYDYKGEPDKLMIICPGNGQWPIGAGFGVDPSTEWIDYAKANKISWAVIRTQDSSTPTISGTGYNTDKTGWGNNETLKRVKDLYDYCQQNYNFHASVVMAGASMGFITAQLLAYMNPFPISDLVSIGGVPNGPGGMFLATGTASRKDSIRASRGMRNDGTQDAQILDFVRGTDNWLQHLITVSGVDYKTLPCRLFILMGEEVGTWSIEFGGAAFNTRMLTAIRNAGGYVEYYGYPGVNHASNVLYTNGFTTGVWSKIFGV